jgi:hypothetical protein
LINRFLNLLAEATASVPPLYFQLPVADREDPIYRERVYAYELYHQLRTLLQDIPEFAPYSLSGEIDKQGHPIIRPCAPDLVIHVPGQMYENLAVVEVKAVNSGQRGIEKDRESLEYFISDEVGYRVGVQLVYGNDEAAVARFARVYAGVNARVRLFWHRQAGEPAIQL